MFFSAPSIEEYFTEINIPYDSEFLLVQSVSRNAKLSLTEVYQDHPSRTLQRHRVANWSSRGGFVWSPIPLFNRRDDLHNIVMRVGVSGEVSAALFVINVPTQQLFVFAYLTKYFNFIYRFILLSAQSAETRQHFVKLRMKYGIPYRINLILSKYNF
jgi:hypothetical protein